MMKIVFTFTNEQTKQARNPRKSFGIASRNDIFNGFLLLQIYNLNKW